MTPIEFVDLKAQQRVLSLPMHPYLTDEEFERIASVLKAACD